VNRLQIGLLLGAGLPLLVAIVLVADRKGLFRLDGFPTALRRRMALALLVVQLALTVLAPAIAGSRPLDPAKVRFPQLFISQGMLALFLVLWWLLSDRPAWTAFLRLRSESFLAEAGTGVCLGVIGWGLTLVVGGFAAIAVRATGLPGPESVPPLVVWVAGLSVPQKLLVIASAMTLEEFFFRAFLQGRLGAVGASILFLLAHAGYGEPFFFVGLVAITAVLAAAFRRSGSTVAPIAAHGTFNAIQLFVVLPAVLKLLDAR
jgi:membrane protease YdiL (CAAX protease family)